MNEWKWNGSRWWKVDFHTHTPASNDYDNSQVVTAEEWLLSYMRAGIDCVVITDHNTGEWVDTLKDALRTLESERPGDFRPIFIFPGVEISVNGGVHLLAILGEDKNTSDIDSLLGVVDFKGNKGSSDSVTNKSFVDVVNAIIQAGGIAIPAHVDKKNGIFELQGQTLQQALDCEDIFAVELVNPMYQKPQLYIDSKLSWCEILGSDAHQLSGNTGRQYPGSRFTWVKMEIPNINGLQLALLDGSLSIRRSDQVDKNPNEHAPLVLESIAISQARYLGRSEEFTVELNPWLNTIIGGRGTGKSTVVELLRIASRRENEMPSDLLADFEKYRQVYQNRNDGGLLTKETTIRVTYRKEDSRFRIQWHSDGRLEPIEQQDANDDWQRAEGDIQQRFPVRIYSQKQIFQLAKMPLALLQIIDEAPAVDYHSWNEKWKIEERQFLSLRAKARELEANLDKESRLRGELEDVKRKLAIFEKSGYADILGSFQKRSRQQREVEVFEESWANTGEKLRNTAIDIVPDCLDQSTFNLETPEDTELHHATTTVCDQLNEICKSVEKLGQQADKIVVDWRNKKEQLTWQQRVNTAVADYLTLKETLTEKNAGKPDEYGKLVQHRQAIEQQLKRFGEIKQQVKQVRKQAEVHLQNLITSRQQLTEARQQFLNDVLGKNHYVKIQVIPYGAKETVEVKFRWFLQKEDDSFGKDIGSPFGDGLLGELYKNSSNHQDTKKNLAAIKNKIKNIASGKEIPADQRFATHLNKLPPEAFDRLDLWLPEDSLDVQYSPTSDGQNFRSIQEGSPGQKTTALLAFLLSYGEEPLILDQPEDDLDNRLIYDLIVKHLRAVKLRRQVIVITHNANIVVNGDAELVIALVARGGETQKECEGSLQAEEVRKTVCAIMEGGNQAFEDRYRRIVLRGHHV